MTLSCKPRELGGAATWFFFVQVSGSEQGQVLGGETRPPRAVAMSPAHGKCSSRQEELVQLPGIEEFVF